MLLLVISKMIMVGDATQGGLTVYLYLEVLPEPESEKSAVK
jgi:hypothetical protein